MVLRTKPPNPSDADAYPTSAKLDAFTFLLDMTDAICISHVDACSASAKCHDAIDLLFDLVDVDFITHVLLHLSMSPDVNHRGWSPGLLVPQSKPHVRPSLLLVHRHGTFLLDLYLAIDHRLRTPYLHITS
jgi:hypothetical protein